MLTLDVPEGGGAPLLAGAVVEVYGTKMGVEALITSVDVPGPFAPGEFLDAIVIPVVTTDLEQIRLAVAHESTEQNAQFKTEDFKEGIQSFVERRKARFSGR